MLQSNKETKDRLLCAWTALLKTLLFERTAHLAHQRLFLVKLAIVVV